ncbi:diaminopropionate ammonia-lyase [Thermotalea metallivorans]|uniref:Diaminopropionate ammonia-lyase n=1 Tax=Thermotalea metallivorans TaxID=520762 RepID=A0A140LEL1_9FIRM|nr:diaminopropionate ammonia-lyase [Thermotalea metallivorans]KXG78986.1 Diaminopropionate ammonia-lyase [Thermotalea metallivorans]
MKKAEEIRYVLNQHARSEKYKKSAVDFMSLNTIAKVRNFHKSFPEYSITPLHNLKHLARYMGVGGIWVKDESYRFGLNAFKVLGGSYAIGKFLSEKLGIDIEDLSFKKFRSKEIKEKLGAIVFVTATDGNHGRGIAWAAKQLGQKAVVFMPKGSSKIRFENIKKEGAEAYITDDNYDDTVRLANAYANQNNGVMVQDTAWEGYEDIPTWIMQGYATLIHEAIEQLEGEGIERPTHVFLQAGVGSFAGAIQGYLAAVYGENRPVTAIVEPDRAACIYQSALAGDGKAHRVTGELDTIMAGLACGEPNMIGWNILRDYSDMYISCPDYTAAYGMRILGNPLWGDPPIISGESGAVGIGVLSCILQGKEYGDMAEKLNINEDSQILFISTEGDTDPQRYREIVWKGHYAI